MCGVLFHSCIGFISAGAAPSGRPTTRCHRLRPRLVRDRVGLRAKIRAKARAGIRVRVRARVKARARDRVGLRIRLRARTQLLYTPGEDTGRA